MGSLSPVQLALIIIGGLAVVGVVVALIRRRATYSGYQDYTADVKLIAAALKGEIFRDGGDLVVSGNYGKMPSIVRFSNDEHTAGLNITVHAPATFALSVTPAEAPSREVGQTPIRTSDPGWDARFTTRTDQPSAASMFLTRQTEMHIQRLCCTLNTYLSMGHGEIELSEAIIPSVPGKHVLDHLKSILKLWDMLHGMPGAEDVPITPFKREGQWLLRGALAVGVIVAIGTVFAARQGGGSATNPSEESATIPVGILPADAASMNELDGWRLATPDDFDLTASNWLRGSGVSPAGSIEGDFSGQQNGRDRAYVLVNKATGQRRLALLVANSEVYDTRFSALAGVTRFPRAEIDSVQWQDDRKPENVTGDGLMLILKGDDPASSTVLFVQGQRVVSYNPTNYQSVRLR